MLFSEYVAALSEVELLSPEEEAALWRACKLEGDLQARARLIESYQPLVCREAQPFRTRPDVMDAVQEGTIGLIEAVERYEPRRGVAFSLYAVHRIRGRILDFLRREGGADIACLDSVTLDNGAQVNLKEGLPDAAAASVAEQAEEAELSARLHGALARLPAKEKAVLEGIYLSGGEARDMAEGLKVSLAHVYRLREKGIRRVRGMLSRFRQNWQ